MPFNVFCNKSGSPGSSFDDENGCVSIGNFFNFMVIYNPVMALAFVILLTLFALLLINKAFGALEGYFAKTETLPAEPSHLAILNGFLLECLSAANGARPSQDSGGKDVPGNTQRTRTAKHMKARLNERYVSFFLKLQPTAHTHIR